MSQYLPSFIRNTKGKYNPELGFVSIKGGTDAYLLEDELNEMQWIQGEARAQLVRQITKSGCLNVPMPNDSNKPGGLVELDHNYLNTLMVKGFDAVFDGYIAHIDTDIEAGFKIELPEPPIVGVRYDFVYLEFWMKEIKQYEPVPRFGGFYNKPASYEIIDSRMNIETSQRVQLQWAMRVFSDAEYPDIINRNLSNITINPQGPNNNINLDHKFVLSNTDKFMFMSGDGSDDCKQALGTSDGKVYAIPLFVVRRLNKSGYNPQYNVDGAVDYVDETTVSGRPDDKFANMVYIDEIIDMRHLSALGEAQNDLIYTRLETFNEYQEYIKANVENSLESLWSDVGQLHTDFNSETVRLDVKIDDAETKLTVAHNADVKDVNSRIDNLDETINNTLTISIGTLNDKINSVNTSLTAVVDDKVYLIEEEIEQLRKELTDIINQDLVVINAEIVDLQADIYDVMNVQVAGLNTKISNTNAQLAITNGNLGDMGIKVDNINAILTDAINNCAEMCHTELLDTKNQIISLLNTDVDNLNKRIDDINATLTINLNIAVTQLNDKIDTVNATLTARIDYVQIEINDINHRIDLLQNQINGFSTLMSGFSSRLTTLETDVRNIKIQLASLFPDGTGTDLLLYGVDMNRKIPTTVGGTITTVGSDMTISSTGTIIGVTFSKKTDYSLVVTPQRPADGSTPDGSIGDVWLSRADTSFTFKNSGLAGIVCDVFAIRNDDALAASDQYIWSNANTTKFPEVAFSGFGSTGTRVDIPMRPATDFVYICPTENYKGEVGEIYVTVDSTGFTVFNTGQAGNKFDWTVINTALYGNGGRLRNILVYDIELPGHDAYYNQAGAFGGDYYNVMVGTPMTNTTAGHTIISPGSIGDISVTKNTGYFTLYNTGSAVSKVRCIVFKQVDAQMNA